MTYPPQKALGPRSSHSGVLALVVAWAAFASLGCEGSGDLETTPTDVQVAIAQVAVTGDVQAAGDVLVGDVAVSAGEVQAGTVQAGEVLAGDVQVEIAEITVSAGAPATIPATAELIFIQDETDPAASWAAELGAACPTGGTIHAWTVVPSQYAGQYTVAALVECP